MEQAHQEYWDRFISLIENDTRGRQSIVYKFMKTMDLQKKEEAHLNAISGKNLIHCYEE